MAHLPDYQDSKERIATPLKKSAKTCTVYKLYDTNGMLDYVTMDKVRASQWKGIVKVVTKYVQ